MDRQRMTIVPMETELEMDGKAYVHWKSWHETYQGLMSAEYLEKWTLERCLSIARRWPQNTLVLKVDQRVVGFVCFGDSREEDLENSGEIIALYLLEAYQGQRLGYELMCAALVRLADKERITLWVLRGNEKAIRFYCRCGFRPDGKEKPDAAGTVLRMTLEKDKST